MKKRILSALLAIVMLISALPFSAIAYGTESYGENENTVKYGDVNGDGEVNSLDVDLLARYLAMDASATINLTAADVDVNGKVDLNDLLNLVKYVKGDTNVSLGDTVTVTFNTNGGSPIDPVTVMLGSTITAPKAEKDNAIFLGWFTDEALTVPFYSSDPIVESLTVYAKYADVNGAPEYTPAVFALTDQAPDLVFTVERISGELEPMSAVTLTSIDGSVAPALIFAEAGTNKWTVKADGGYKEGASYTMTLADGYIFEGKEESIRQASFYIDKEEVDNFVLNEDIIYIQDTVDMTYYLSDGTSCEILDANVLYDSTDVIKGTFSYTGEATLEVGDTLCIYVTTIPTQRDYINETYEDDPTAYLVVEEIVGSTVSFRGMTMQGENNDVEKLISLPSTLPFSILNPPTGDGTIDFTQIDLAALYTMYNTNAPQEAKVGDFLVFYAGHFGSLREGDPVYYKKVVAVNGTTISYVASTKEELLGAMNLYLENEVDGESMLENIDQDALKAQALQQITETNFAKDAMQYLAKVVGSSEEFYSYVEQSKITLYDENGMELTEEQIKAYGLGNSFELKDDIEFSFNITLCNGENSHFDSGIKLTLSLEAEFEVDIGKEGKMGSLKIELGASFTQEVCIDISVNANADITWILFVPKINDIVISTGVDVMSYTGVSVEAKFYTQEPDEDFFDKLKENWGDKLGEKTMKKIEEFKEKYEKKFDEDSLGEDIETFWEAQTDLITELIKNGEITKEQAQECFKKNSENHIVQTFFSKLHIMNDEDYGAGVNELAERYSEMLGEEDNGWLELCKIKMFEKSKNLKIFQITISGHFVVRANLNVALGANLEYEVGKRYVNWFSVFGNGSGSERIDLVDPRFAFQFYAMGHLGLKAGLLFELNFGIVSTKIGSVGVSAEFGAFIEMYGYVQYTYTKTKPAGSTEWESEDSLFGALFFEFGLYTEIKINAQLLSLLEKSWELYSGKWQLLSAGSQQNIYGFATELEDGEKIAIIDKDANSSNGIISELSENFRSMKSLDMVEGEQDTPVMPWISYYDYNFWGGDDFSITQHRDKVNFTYTLSSKYFKMVPVYEEKDGKQYLVDYEIQVDVPEGVHYLSCDLRLVWTLDKLCWSKYDMDITIPLVWTDLADEELIEYRSATVKVGNETDGYHTVWSDRFLKGEAFTLPSEEEILDLVNYSGSNDLEYSGYDGYTRTNRGNNITSLDQSLTFDTIFYFDLSIREYEITIKDVQNPDGTLKDMTFRAKYGEKFDFSELISTGTEKDGEYTIFAGIDVVVDEDENEDTIIKYITDFITPTEEIKGVFATMLLRDTYSYCAKYVKNSGEVTYKFTGVDIPPITKVYKKGEMPSVNDFLPEIDAVVGSDIAYVSSVSPIINTVKGDVVYSVTVTLPEKELEKYTITYESNGGSSVPAQTIEERSVMLPPANPTRAGYTFVGWYYDANFETPVTWGRSMPSVDFTLYAKWTVNTYTVTFNAGEGSTTVGSKNVVYDSAVGSLPNASRANYIFLGWFTALSGGTQYTANTVYKTDGNITLYAHWQLKATIATSNVTVSSKTTTYNGSSVPVSITNNLGLDMSSFTVSYKRQVLDRSWSSALPVNAGTYDVRISRAEDGQYLAFEYVYTAKIIVNKASRTISSSGLTAQAYYGNIAAISTPSYVGDGTPMYRLENSAGTVVRSWQTSAGFFNVGVNNFRIGFYVAEGENYKASNNVYSNTIYVNAPPQSEFKSIQYWIYFHTKNEAGAGADAGGKVNVQLGYTDGAWAVEDTLDNVAYRNKTSEEQFSTVYLDPWTLKSVKVMSKKGSAVVYDSFEIRAVVGGTNLCYIDDNNTYTLSKGGTNEHNISHAFKRWITSVGDFTNTVNLSLNGSNGKYTYTYNGKVVDNFSSWTNSGYYNCYAHYYAPTLSVSCSRPTINGHNYAQYFGNGVNTVTIDRDGLYKAMIRDGVTSISATATLTFDSTSTGGGNTWKKTFNISLPAAAMVSEGMDAYYAAGEGNINVQTQEDKDYLYVTLGLNNNPGVWGVKNTVDFDANALELVSAVEGSLSSDYIIETSLNDGAYTLLAYRDHVRESYATGTFVTLTFKKKVETIDLSTALKITNDQTIDDQAQPVLVNDTFDMSDFTSVPPTDDNTYLVSDSEIVNSLDKHISERNPETLILHYKTNKLVTEQDLSAWFHEVIDKLDSYAFFGIQRYTATASKYTKDDVYYYTLSYTVEYYTTNAEEQAFEEKLDEVIAELNLSGKSDLEKILIIYDYVCENVTYDATAAHPFTAYGALIEGKAVCQGYALLLMRMLEKVSIEADVIFGDAEGINHMWNIVKLDGEYFLLDATWDSADERECYFWFLKGIDDFDGHTPNSSYAIGTSKDNHDSASALSHNFADATCDSPATCAKCHTTTGSALGHLDVNRDHACDRGCAGMLGEHADSATDNNHVCDYGCGAILEACSGATGENNYVCVVCGNEVVKDSVTAALDKAIEDLEQAIANGDADLDDKITNLTNALNAAKLAFENADAANKTELEGKIANAQNALQAAIDEIKQNLADAKAELEQAIANGDADLDDKITNLTNALNAAKLALEGADAANKTELEGKIANAQNALQAAIDEVAQNLADAKAELEQAIANGDADLDDKITNLTNALNAAKLALENADAANKTELEGKINTAQTTLQAAIDEIKQNLADAKADLEQAIANGDADLDDKITNLTNALNAAKLALENADAANKTELEGKINTAQTTLQAAINEVAQNLADAKAELEQAIANGDADLDDKITNLTNALNAAKLALESADAANKTELEGKIANAQNALQAAIDEIKQNLTDAKAELEQAIADGDADLDDKITNLTDALNAAKLALENADAANKTELEGKIANAQNALQAAIDEIAQNLADAKAELEQAIANGDADLDDKITNLTNALNAAKLALESADAANKTELEGKINNAQTTLQAAIDEIKQNLADAKADLEQAIANGDADLDDKITNLTNALNAAKLALEGADATNKTELEGKIANAQNALQAAIDEIKQNLADAKADLEQAIADSEADLNAKINNLTSALLAAKLILEGADAANKIELEGKINTAQTTLQAAIDEIKQNLADAKAELEQAIANGDANLDDKITNLTNALNAAKLALENADAANKTELEGKINNAQTTLQAAIEEIKQNLADAKAELEQAIANGDADLDDKITNLTNALNAAKLALESADATNKTELEGKIANAQNALQAAIEEIKQNLADAKAELEQAIANGDADLDDKITNLTNALNAAKLALESADATNKTELEGKINTAQTTLQAVIDEIKQNLADAKAELEQAIADGDADLDDKITNLTNALNAAKLALEGADVANKTELEGKINNAQTALQLAIEEIKQNLADAKAELEQAIANGDADLDDKITNLTNALNAAKLALENADAANKTELEGKINTAQTTLQAAIDEIKQNLADAKAELEQAIANGDADLDDKITKLTDALNAAKLALESADAANKTELEGKINNAQTTLQAAIEEIKQNLADAKAELEQAIADGDADLDDKITNLTNALNAAKLVLESADATNKTELEGKINNAQTALQLAIDEIKQNLADAKAELEQAIANGDADLDDKITNLTNALNAAKLALEGADAANKTELEGKIANAQNALQAAINEIAQNLADAKAELEQAIANGDADLDDKITNLTNALNAAKLALENADAANKTELEGKINTAQTTLQAAIEQIQSNLDNVKSELDQAIANLKSAMEKGDSDLSAEIAALNTALENAKSALVDADAANKTELEGKIANAQNALQAAIDEVASDLAQAQRELENAIATGDAALNERIDSVNAALNAAKDVLEKAVLDNKAALESKIEAAEASLDAAIKAVQKNLDDAKAELEQAIANGNAALDAKITNLTNALNAAKSALEATDRANKAELEGKMYAADAILQAAIDKVASDLAHAQKELANAIATGDAALNERIDSVNAALNAAKAALEKAGADNKAALEAKIEAAESILDAAIKAVQKNLDDAKAELDKAIADGDSALDDKISALTDALAIAKAALEATDSANKSELITKIDEADATLKAAIDALSNELNATNEKVAELETFIMIVCVISGVAFCGCGTLAVFYIIDKRRKSK